MKNYFLSLVVLFSVFLVNSCQLGGGAVGGNIIGENVILSSQKLSIRINEVNIGVEYWHHHQQGQNYAKITPKGGVFLVANVTIQNISEEEINFDFANIKFKDGTKTTTLPSFAVEDYVIDETIYYTGFSNDIDPNDEMTRTLVFTVSKDFNPTEVHVAGVGKALIEINEEQY